MNSMIQSPVRDHLDDVPSYEEIQPAIGYLKSCKAASESDIPPELLMSEAQVTVDMLVELFVLVWRDKSICC